MRMKNSTYDQLVVISEIGTQAVAAILCLFGDTFGIPFACTIGGFIAGVGAIIGVALRESRKVYTPKAFDDEADDDVVLAVTEVRDDE